MTDATLQTIVAILTALVPMCKTLIARAKRIEQKLDRISFQYNEIQNTQKAHTARLQHLEESIAKCSLHTPTKA